MENTITYEKLDGTVPFNNPVTVSASVVLAPDDRSSGDPGLIDDGKQEAAPRRAPTQARMRCGLIAESRSVVLSASVRSNYFWEAHTSTFTLI